MEESITKKKRNHWKKSIKQWLSSNQSASAFCRENNVVASTFNYWRSRLDPNYKGKEKTPLAQDPPFIPVQIIKEEPSTPQEEKEFTLHCPNGCFIKLPKNFDKQTFSFIHELMGIKSC